MATTFVLHGWWRTS
ncbi:trp operon leader peptide [Salmonella enterica]|nr:trp operon leader peptide [Salmonella enterica]